MVKVKRLRTADAVVVGWRPGKEEGTVGSLILGLYDGDELRVVGHTSGLKAKEKRELVDDPGAVRDRRARLGRPEPLGGRPRARVGLAAPRAGGRGHASTTSPPAASATARRSCAGATTRTRRTAASTSSSSKRDASSPSARPRWSCGLLGAGCGCTRFGSPSASGECGGHGASPSGPRPRRAPAMLVAATRASGARRRSSPTGRRLGEAGGTVSTPQSSAGATSPISSQLERRRDAGASGLGRTRCRRRRRSRSRAFWL